MRTSGQRIDKHAANYAPTTVGLKVAAQLGTMKSGFMAAVGPLVQVGFKIQAVLNKAGVPTIQYPFYLNFGREMWHLYSIGVHGPAFLDRATDLHAKYVSYGLATAELKVIAIDVFNCTIV